MSAIFDLVLGVVTSIGGFVEAGSISTAAQAGSEFGLQLLWAIAIATVMLAMLVEMSGRLSAVARRSMVAAVRERFGIKFQIVPLAAELMNSPPDIERDTTRRRLPGFCPPGRRFVNSFVALIR